MIPEDKRKAIAEMAGTEGARSAAKHFGVALSTVYRFCANYRVRPLRGCEYSVDLLLAVLKALIDGQTESDISEAFGCRADFIDQVRKDATRAGFEL